MAWSPSSIRRLSSIVYTSLWRSYPTCNSISIRSVSTWGCRSFVPQYNRIYYSNLIGIATASTATNVATSSSSCITSQCWSCHRNLQSGAGFFCPHCRKVLSPADAPTNFFDIFSYSADYVLHTKALERAFRDLQMKLHPDRFTSSSKQELAYSAHHSALINKAYRTLLCPIRRAEYILECAGMPIEEGHKLHSEDDNKFLMEMMDLNESLLSAEDTKELAAVTADVKERMDKAIDNLTVSFSSKNYEDAKSLVIRLRFYEQVADRAKYAI